jgi:hypothetical protein
MEKHNGYTNYSTWLVGLWLMNDEKNDNRLKVMDYDDFNNLDVDELYLFDYGDDRENIDFKEVNVKEITEILIDIYEVGK